LDLARKVANHHHGPGETRGHQTTTTTTTTTMITPSNATSAGFTQELPSPPAPKTRGRKPGYESTLRKTGFQTRVARIPKHWGVEEITESIGYLTSLVEQYEDEIKESISRSDKGEMSNRYEKLAEALGEIRAIGLPKI